MSLFSGGSIRLGVSTAVFAMFSGLFLHAQAPKPDVLVFTNGDQLTGKLERAVGGSVVFKSDMAGELTIPFDKIKTLNSGTEFVAIKHGTHKKPETTTGTVEVAGSNVTLKPASPAPEVTIASSQVNYLIDAATYQKELTKDPGFFHAWNGTITGGATLVRSTQSATTLTAGISLVRAIPTVPYLPPRNRTTFNVIENYGKSTTPAIPPTDPATPDAVVKTSIFHADAERDEYFSPRLYALGDVSFDHNFSQGLNMQQVYGGGIGWTPIKTPKQTLDVKADVHYEMQSFLAPEVTPGAALIPAAPSVNLFGSTFSEDYTRNLPYKLVFTESGSYLPAWTQLDAYSANVTAALAIPVFKRLNAVVSVTDNYLNDPPEFYKKNSFQFVTGVTYNLH